MILFKRRRRSRLVISFWGSEYRCHFIGGINLPKRENQPCLHMNSEGLSIYNCFYAVCWPCRRLWVVHTYLRVCYILPWNVIETEWVGCVRCTKCCSELPHRKNAKAFHSNKTIHFLNCHRTSMKWNNKITWIVFNHKTNLNSYIGLWWWGHAQNGTRENPSSDYSVLVLCVKGKSIFLRRKNNRKHNRFSFNELWKLYRISKQVYYIVSWTRHVK